MIPFVKMHGCGNDFVIVRAADLDSLALDAQARTAWVQRVCERHFGLGADGLLAYTTPSPTRVRMHYWNQDGSRAEMCGNGARCVVRLAYERGETGPTVELESDAGTHPATVLLHSGRPEAVRLGMGKLRWDGEAIGLHDKPELVDAALRVGDEELRVTAVALGNPHAVVFAPSSRALERLPLEVLGPLLSEHRVFARGANASFVAVESDALHLRVWERGAGPTLACGTAACASLGAAWRLGRLSNPRARVRLPGGEVQVELDEEGYVWLTGPAARVAEGTLDADLIDARGARPEPSD